MYDERRHRNRGPGEYKGWGWRKTLTVDYQIFKRLSIYQTGQYFIKSQRFCKIHLRESFIQSEHREIM